MDNNKRFNELALFAGAGGGILGGHLLNWRTVCAVEIEPFCAAVLAKRQEDGYLPPFPIWDDVSTFDGKPWRGKIDVISGGFPCFVAGTSILTECGWKPIEQVTTDDYVLTHKGRWRRVTSTMCREGANLWRVKGFGFFETLTTEEHPFFVSKGKGTSPEFVKVSDLTTKHWVTMVLPGISESDQHSEDWWWLVGRYLADGWRVDRKGRKNGRVVISCNDSKSEELERRIQLAGFNFTKVKERTCNKYHITKGVFYEELEQFGRYAHGKHLNRLAYELPIEKARALFYGYLSGDGQRNRTEAGSTSKSLCLDMCILAKRIGAPIPMVHHTKRKPKCTIEGRVCNQRDLYMFRVANKNICGFFDGEYFHKRIRKLERTNIISKVYNISVDEDESYVANGAIVHNCQDVSVAGKGTGIEGERSGLWREFARIISEVRPKYAFVENSPALRTRGLTRVLSDLAEIGYDAVWTIMGAYEVGAPHIRKRIWILAIDSKRSDILPHSDLRGSGRREQLPEGFEEEGRVSDSSGERREEISVQSGEFSEALEETSEWKPCRTDCNVSDSSDKGNVRRNGEHGANEEAGSTGCNNGGGTQEDDCGEWWGVEPGICRVVDGVPYRVDRLKALGNAQVPLVAAAAFKVLKNILDKKYKELK